MLCTLRPAEAIASGHPVASVKRELLRKGVCRELTLSGLGTADVASYLAVRFAGSAVADELAPWVGRCPAGHEHFRYRAPIRPLSCGLCRRGFDRSNLIVWHRREITGAMRRAAASAAADPASPGAGSR